MRQQFSKIMGCDLKLIYICFYYCFFKLFLTTITSFLTTLKTLLHFENLRKLQSLTSKFAIKQKVEKIITGSLSDFSFSYLLLFECFM